MEINQDIYNQPKLIKKKRKKADEQNLVIGTNTKEIILSILPDRIKQLDKNLESKVMGRHLALHRSNHSNSLPNQEPGSEKVKQQILRRQRYCHLERLIKHEQLSWRYQALIPLHRLWIGYMSELLGLDLLDRFSTTPNSPSIPDQQSVEEKPAGEVKGIPSIINMQAKLLKADYHGAILTVTRAKNPSVVNLQGIVVQETQETFRIIDIQNSVKCVPKRHTVFKLELELISKDDQIQQKQSLVWEIYGNQFAFRAADRVGKKFKTKAFVEL